MHNYLVYCNDVLVSMLQYVDEHRLTSMPFQFDSNEKAAEFDLNNQMYDSENTLWQDWLIENGYKESMYEIYYRHTLFSLVSDLCNYIIESINCAAKMKIAVSYALLRKPLKDSLGYIEWLFVNKNEMLNLLVNGSPEDLELKRKRLKRMLK